MEVERDAWVVNRAAVDAIIVVTADISKLLNVKLKILLLLLKLKEDGAMPTKKADMLLKYMAWKDRPPPVFEIQGITEEQVVSDEVNMENKNETAQALVELGLQTDVV